MGYFAWIFLTCTFLLAQPSPAQQTPDQAAIAEKLRSSEIDIIQEGISAVNRIPHWEWTPELRDAILYALEAEHRRDREAMQAKEYRFADENLAISLTDFAMVMQAPAAIPMLVTRCRRDHDAWAALVAFGRQALSEVIRVARDEDGTGFDLDIKDCIIALRQMVQVKGVAYFTAEELREIKAVAALYLAPDTSPLRHDWSATTREITTNHAAGLPLVLEDAEARSWVVRLASDRAASEAWIGFEDSFGGGVSATWSRRELRKLLDGEELLPRPVPFSEFLKHWNERYR